MSVLTAQDLQFRGILLLCAAEGDAELIAADEGRGKVEVGDDGLLGPEELA